MWPKLHWQLSMWWRRGAGLTLVPESPRWQLSKGMQVEAAEGAVLLWGPTGPSQLTEGAPPGGPRLLPAYNRLSSRAPLATCNARTIF